MNDLKTYADKLKDPRWQKKRLEVLQRDDFTCVKCQATDKSLHVHHVGYVFGREPWEYPSTNFKTLCEGCHLVEEDYKTKVNNLIYDIQLMGFSLEAVYNVLVNYLL